MNGEKIVNIIEEVFADDISSQQGISRLLELKKTEGNKINCAIRLLKAFENQAYYDFCGHLRQVIVFYGYPVKVQNRQFFKFTQNNLTQFGLTTIGERDNIKFSANPKILPNEKLSTIYKYEKRVKNDLAIGDGRLYNYTGYKTYRSFAQKILLNQISNAQFGDTILACLPTGAGKSLSWQLPGIANEYSGLIIVIVPTVALAINHEESSSKMFDKANSNLVRPKAYYADCGRAKKQQIKEEILSGVLPILYISPEALMQNEFKEMMLEAAKLNRISMLVVDEAHLIVDWGSKFRPEFQLIPSFRNSINESGNKIKTLLLSATLTENDTEIIRNIFEDDNNFIEYRADALRPEISYKLDFYENNTHRIQTLKKLVLQAPKPIIVYSALVQTAENLYNAILETGLKNVRLFTGKTSTRDRKQIMYEWDTDKVDIIVATSAFGMGVDKSDIRTIIHTFIPENVSRFYQESGRAGRDGFSALDYCMIVSNEDKDNAHNLVKSSILTPQKIVDRWFALKNNSEIVDGNCMWIDTHTTPKHLLKSITGEQNADWNKGIILFLYRNHFIDILDMSLKSGDDYLIKIKLLKYKELENEKLMEEAITPLREIERYRVDSDLDNSFEIFKLNHCFGNIFKYQYEHAEEICSGCPYCEKNNNNPYYIRNTIKIFKSKEDVPINEMDLSPIIKHNKETLLLCDSYKINNGDLISYLLQQGVYNIVIPNLKENELENIYNKIKFFSNVHNLLIFNSKEFIENDLNSLIRGPIAIVLSDDLDFNNKVFKFVEKYGKTKQNHILFVSKENVVDRRYNKEISNTEKFMLGKVENVIGGEI